MLWDQCEVRYLGHIHDKISHQEWLNHARFSQNLTNVVYISQ